MEARMTPEQILYLALGIRARDWTTMNGKPV